MVPNGIIQMPRDIILLLRFYLILYWTPTFTYKTTITTRASAFTQVFSITTTSMTDISQHLVVSEQFSLPNLKPLALLSYYKIFKLWYFTQIRLQALYPLYRSKLYSYIQAAICLCNSACL